MKPKIRILGIVNLTDDSYYAPSRAASGEAFLSHVRQLVEEGADLVDIGACSTRPGSRPVGAEEEWKRLEPALKALRSEFPDLPVSIDTYWSPVVARVYDCIGPFTVNDISAGAMDPSMLPLVGGLGLPYIAMHMRGTPETMQSLTDYPEAVFRRCCLPGGRGRHPGLDPGPGLRFREDGSAELDAVGRAGPAAGPRKTHLGRHLPQEHDLQALWHYTGGIAPRYPGRALHGFGTGRYLPPRP